MASVLNKLAIFSMLLLMGACGEFFSQENIFSNENIDKMIAEGSFSEAENVIKIKLATDTLSKSEQYELLKKIEIMERIRIDFNQDDSSVLAYIKNVYPDVTAQEIAGWEASNALEHMTIDGQKKYFHLAGRNLFRIDKDAQAKWDGVKGRQSDDLDMFLSEYLPDVVKEVPDGAKHGKLVKPVRMRIRYTITVPAGEVPAGEMIRVWMPYPRTNVKHSDIKLLSTTQQEYIIAPDSYAHKSIYMEQPAKKDSAAVFGYELSYTSYNMWFDFKPEDVQPYDTTGELYREFTKERSTHIIFTEDIKRITDSIVGDEENPYLKCVRIFDYIADNYPWASAREYSTIENIPQYVIDNGHGDCGQVSLLFITMARYAGVPAKWQSGWMFHPDNVNLHDWAEVYFEGIGWVPVDQSFGLVRDSDNDDVLHFYTKGLDAYRYIVNDDYSGDLYPAKIYPRSETVDFQRGEVEWRGENLYFGRWRYRMEVEYK